MGKVTLFEPNQVRWPVALGAPPPPRTDTQPLSSFRDQVSNGAPLQERGALCLPRTEDIRVRPPPHRPALRAFALLGRACYFPGVGTPAAASARSRVGIPVYLLCHSCVFKGDRLRLAAPRGRTRLQRHLLNTRHPCALQLGGARIRLGGRARPGRWVAPRRCRRAGAGQPRAQAGPPPVPLRGLGGPGCRFQQQRAGGRRAASPSRGGGPGALPGKEVRAGGRK